MANKSITQFRVHEVEQKPNFASVIRGTNYDPKFYMNDKDVPAEDIQATGESPRVAESSWSSRFFFLPTRLCSSLASVVGTKSRVGQMGGFPNGRNPGGTYGGNIWRQTDSERNMECYAVTTDPLLVPTTPVALDVYGTGNQDDSWPDEPSYRYWNGAELRIAAYHSTTMNDPTPPAVDTHYDERGPFETFHYNFPWAFSVYETRGITSINGAQFVCAGRQPYEGICPTWLRTAVGPLHSRYWAYSTTGYGPFDTCCLTSVSLSPLCAYVLRPSTGQIVGWLAWDNINTAKQNLTASPSTINTIVQTEQIQWTYAWGGFANVTGMQDGDLIVWEWWSFNSGSVWMMNRNSVIAGTMVKSPVCHVRTYWGGGLAGQPLTKTGGIPNWAPAHRSDLGAMTGYKPR